MIQGVRRKTLVQILSKVLMKPNGVKENRKTLEMVRIHEQYFYIVGSYPCRPMTICQFEVSQKIGVVFQIWISSLEILSVSQVKENNSTG